MMSPYKLSGFFVFLTALAIQAGANTSSPPTEDQPVLDEYGGLLSIKSGETGFFRLEKLRGRWWFITPKGHPFLSIGVNHVDYKEDDSDRFVRFVVRYLQDWGFNTIGWSQELMGRDGNGHLIHSAGWGPRQYRTAQMPYVHLIRFTDIEWYVEPDFPDVFSDQFVERCDSLAKQICLELRNDPFLIGYFYSDAPNWPLWAKRLGASKLKLVAERYYRVIHDAIRRYDSNHLILGDRYKADRVFPEADSKIHGMPDEVLDAMKETVDVLSIEYYRPGDWFEQDLEEWHQLTGKPILLADSAFLAPTDVLKISPSSPIYVSNQAERGLAYLKFARRVFSKPQVVGWHWCAFGRSKGRNSGLLDGEDKPYQECVKTMREFNKKELYTVALKAPNRAYEEKSEVSTARLDPDNQRDRYGGTTVVKAESTGFFRAIELNGRWWLITPDGQGFISMGMNHLDLSALKYPDNLHIFKDRYGGDTDRFIQEGIAKSLKEWGFNTIGWSQELVGGRWTDPKSILRHSPEWSYHQFQTAGLPYVYNFQFSEIESFNRNPNYPDVFSEEFAEWVDYLARTICVDMADESLLLGYADVPVPAITANRPGSWAEGLDLEKVEDRAKLEKIIRQYFKVTIEAIRRYDRNHLIFGPRFDRPSGTPDWIIEVAGEYFDVLLCNRFITSEIVEKDLARWHKLSGRPILISDQGYLASTDLLKVGPKAPSYVPNQRARGEAYQRFAEQVIKLPYIVGVHWCGFLENRVRKSGIKNYLDEPYWDCVNAMKEFNRNCLYSTALSD